MNEGVIRACDKLSGFLDFLAQFKSDIQTYNISDKVLLSEYENGIEFKNQNLKVFLADVEKLEKDYMDHMDVMAKMFMDLID